jgi:hypothetical protein
MLLIAASALLAASSAFAQTAAVALPRADAHVVIGWQNLRHEQPEVSGNDWLNAIVYGGAGAGWYWTDHLKTQIDAGAGSEGQQYRFQQLSIDGKPVYESSRVHLRQQSVAVSQQYQFFRNRWFHPHVGAGVDLARETTTISYDPLFVFDDVTHSTHIAQPPHEVGPAHRFVARGFGEAGFKAYVTRRAFFTGDMRVMFRGGAEEVLFRAGFGFDF